MKFGLREVIFLAILLAVPAASWWYVFNPRNQDIEQATDEIAAKRGKLEQLREVSSQIDDLGVAIEEGRRAIEIIESKLPSEQGIDSILSNTWELARRNQLVVKSVKTDKSVPAARYMERPLQVVMEGEFDGFYQFLLDQEQLPRITRIKNMTLERRAGSKGVGQNDGFSEDSMRAEFTLSIYYEKPQESAGE